MAREKRLKLSELTDEEYQELYEYETEQERKGLRRLGFFFCLLQLLMSALLMYQVWTTGFLPLKFFIVGCAALFLLFVLTVIIVTRKKRWIKVIGLLLSLVLFLFLAVVNFYVYKVYNSLGEVTGAEYKVDNMVVVVRKEDKAKTIQDAANYTFAVNASENAQNLSRMKANVEKQTKQSVTVKEYPNVTYNLWCGTVDDLTDRLRSGLLDLAITMSPKSSDLLEGIPVYSENWIAIIPKDHPLGRSKKETVSVNELVENDLIISSRRSREEEMRTWFKDTGKEPHFIVKAAHSSNAVHLVGRGIGIALFTASVAKNIPAEEDVVIKKITPEKKVKYLLSWNKEKAFSALAGNFIEHVKGLYGIKQ